MNYTADFETTTDENDCRVWAYGLCNIDTQNLEFGNDIEDFILWCENHPNSNLYFHNLKFDGQFIIDYLLKNGYEYSEEPKDRTFSALISKQNVFYNITINFEYKSRKKKNQCKIYDSLKILPMPVEKVAKAFDLPIRKLELDYNEYREAGHELTNHEKEYLTNDILIMAMALKHQFDENLTKMTAGSNAFAWYKNLIGKQFDKLFPVLDIETDEFIRKSYKGGSTQVNPKYKNKDIGEGIVFDVNSLYPSIMYTRVLPYGIPVYYKGDYKHNKNYPLYIQHCIVDLKLKKDHIPSIQVKNNFLYRSTEYITETLEPTEMWLTNVDIELMNEQYEVLEFIPLDGYMFKGKTGMFKEYIDYWIEKKNTTTGGLKQLAKLMLNSLYGKFGTNPDVTGMEPYEENGIIKYRVGTEKKRDPVYTALACFVTAYGRKQTISSCQQVYDRYLYMDTDSMHLLGTEIPTNILVDDKKLGYWKHESTFQRARFLRAKTYIEDIDGELNVKCAGMTEKIKQSVTWENFHYGFKSNEKLRPKKVAGGIVLVNTPFEIKE